MSDKSYPQSASEVRAALTARGLRPNRQYGQNFLIEPRLLDVIVRLAELDDADFVLEVGTGTGLLTRRLVETASQVVTVEIDAGLHALSRDLLGDVPNLRLVHGDILETKTSLHSEVCERVDVALVDPAIQCFKVVANLPYNVTTPFLSSLLTRFGAPDLVVVLVQKELADNLVAKPSSRAYSPLSILVQLLCDVTVERTLPCEVFWPRPKVDSAIVVARSRGTDALPVLRAYRVIQFLFTERRKMLATVLKKLPPTLGGPLDTESVERLLGPLGLTGRERAESLTPDLFLALDRAISENTGQG